MTPEGRLHPYALPLQRPWPGTRGRVRRGWLLELRDGETSAFGDAATPPGASPRAHRHIGNALREWMRRGPTHRPAPGAPAPARHAIEQAQACRRAMENGRSLAQELRHAGTSLRPSRGSVEVNALLPADSGLQPARAARSLVRQGYGTLKIKLGPRPSGLRFLAAVREAIGPRVRLRVDANGSWGAQAARILTALSPLDIEYAEQPVPPGSVRDWIRLHRDSPVPLAADESLVNPQEARALVAHRAVDVVILKPMAQGGFAPCLQLAETARQAGIGAVVTDSGESAVGRLGALHLAALLGPSAPACGVGSGTWLRRDVVPNPPAPRAGAIATPAGPGLGIEAELRRRLG